MAAAALFVASAALQQPGWLARSAPMKTGTGRPRGGEAGPFRGNCKYVTFSEIPAGTKSALVRFSGTQGNTCCIFDFRIDADYKEPAGGFRPVQVTYVWDEAGVEKKDVHVAK